MPSMLMKAPERPDDRSHEVRFGFGAGVDPKLHAAFEARFGFPLGEGWAMTETGVAVGITNNAPRPVDRPIVARCAGARGRPAHRQRPGRGLRSGGEPGELLVRRAGPDPRFGFFTEYYKNPQATAEVWAGGWFHTGDIVRRDAEGRVFFVDRKKNVIRRSGENIAAVEVESVLMRHPSVRAAGVAPVPDAIRGDEVFACLKVDDPSLETARAIDRLGAGPDGLFQGAGLHRLRRRTAVDGDAEDPARGTQDAWRPICWPAARPMIWCR
jgi:acyl-coenzyme A synthetase/AMP-(fatty) acid ligase